MKISIADYARFDEKIAYEPNCGCWLWTGSDRGNGYGVLKVRGRQVSAHRISYERFVGPIPRGLQIDHKCRVRCCVNPDHIETVTARENMRRGIPFSTAHHRNKTHCRNGHPFVGNNLYLRPAGAGRDCRACRAAAMLKFRKTEKAA